MIDLEIDGHQLDQMVLDMAATEDQARLALRSTLNKMAAWLRVRSVKGLSKELRMQQAIIRRRLRAVKFKQTPDGGVAKVWYGLNPVDLIWLKAKETGSGVSAQGGRFVKGGFIATKQVFKRTGAARLPIQKQSDAIEKPAEKTIAADGIMSAEFERQFWKTFEHELKWRTR
jgi:hypothetical protein